LEEGDFGAAGCTAGVGHPEITVNGVQCEYGPVGVGGGTYAEPVLRMTSKATGGIPMANRP